MYCTQALEIWRPLSDILECRDSSKVRIREVRLVFLHLRVWEICMRKVQRFTNESKSWSCLSEIRSRKCLITQTNSQSQTWLIPTQTRYKMKIRNQSTNIWVKLVHCKSLSATRVRQKNNILCCRNSKKSSLSSSSASSVWVCSRFAKNWEKKTSSSDSNFRSATGKNGTFRVKLLRMWPSYPFWKKKSTLSTSKDQKLCRVSTRFNPKINCRLK